MRRLIKRVAPLIALCVIFSCSDNSTGPDTGNDDAEDGNNDTVTYTVDVSKSPTEGGSIAPSTNETYEEGATAELEAEASEGFRFTEWTGDVESEYNPLSITVDQDYELTANFAKKNYSLTTTSEGEGAVSEEVIEQASKDYEHGTVVELTANPADGWKFVEWSGDMSGSENPKQLTVDETKEVTAVFEKKSYELSITSDGEGAVNEEVIQDKATDYDHGTVVELTANPAEGWKFSEWTGDLSGSENPRQLTVDEPKEVTAVFEEKASEPPSISSVDPQEGTVGTEVAIEGSNFSAANSENVVTFNGTEADVKGASETGIVTSVPEGATDGPIKVAVDGQSTTGPDFEVLPAPKIDSISPEEGDAGTEVTITGSNFRPDPSKNTVIFGYPNLDSSVEAPVISATSTEIVAKVPEEAEARGYRIHVKIGGQAAEGDSFDVLILGDLKVTTATSGSDQDFNGYTLDIDGQDSQIEQFVPIGTDETIIVEDLEVGTYEIGLDITTIASNCTRSVNGNSTVEIRQGEVTEHDFNLTCEATNATQDQGKIYYVSTGDNIRVTNPDGSANDAITNSTEFYDNSPAVSPDGEHIAFLSDRDGSYDDDDLYVMDITGQNIQKIADNDLSRFEFSWSPDGTELAIIDDNETFIINRDGSNRRLITDNATAVDWSPDGDEIAVGDKNNPGNVKVVSLQGEELRSFSVGGEKITGIEYSPDGSEMIITADYEDKSELFFVNANGENVRTTYSSNFDTYSNPSWSPDGSRFVYQKTTDTPTYSSAVVVVDIESGDSSTLFHPADLIDPFWGPVIK